MSDTRFSRPSTVSIYGSRRQDGYVGDICQLIDVFLSKGLNVNVDRRLASILNEGGYRLALHGVKECARMPEDTNLLISIGGDGTFLRTAKWAAGKEIPILGINTGHLGFLAENAISDSEEIVDSLLTGKYREEKRIVIEAGCEERKIAEWPYALNEIAFLKAESASMITVRVEVDGNFLADYSADGLIMATPTGSTAYNLSVGGPILQPTLRNIILSPIAPHTLTLRPIVLGADSRLKATVTSRKGDFRLSIDGHSVVLPCGIPITVSRASHSVITLRRDGDNFATTLRNKFKFNA